MDIEKKISILEKENERLNKKICDLENQVEKAFEKIHNIGVNLNNRFGGNCRFFDDYYKKR